MEEEDETDEGADECEKDENEGATTPAVSSDRDIVGTRRYGRGKPNGT